MTTVDRDTGGATVVLDVDVELSLQQRQAAFIAPRHDLVAVAHADLIDRQVSHNTARHGTTHGTGAAGDS